jgi:putative flippase GtrA
VILRYLRTFLTREAGRQLGTLAIIGVVNTIVYFALVNVFRTVGITLFWRVTFSFAAATLVSYVLNRRWTFRLEGRMGTVAETLGFFGVNLVAWAATVAVVLGAERLLGSLSRLEENLANLVAGGLILLPKLASYRDLVFRRALHRTGRPGPGRVSSAAPPAQTAEPESGGVAPHLPERAQGHSARGGVGFEADGSGGDAVPGAIQANDEFQIE